MIGEQGNQVAFFFFLHERGISIDSVFRIIVVIFRHFLWHRIYFKHAVAHDLVNGIPLSDHHIDHRVE